MSLCFSAFIIFVTYLVSSILPFVRELRRKPALLSLLALLPFHPPCPTSELTPFFTLPREQQKRYSGGVAISSDEFASASRFVFRSSFFFALLSDTGVVSFV